MTRTLTEAEVLALARRAYESGEATFPVRRERSACPSSIRSSPRRTTTRTGPEAAPSCPTATPPRRRTTPPGSGTAGSGTNWPRARTRSSSTSRPTAPSTTRRSRPSSRASSATPSIICGTLTNFCCGTTDRLFAAEGARVVAADIDEAVLRVNPTGTFVVARAVSEASFVTGQVLYVDSGRSIGARRPALSG